MRTIQPPRLTLNKAGIWCIRYHDGTRSREVSTLKINETEARQFFARWLAREGLAPDTEYTLGQAWEYQQAEHETMTDRKVWSWKALGPYFAALKIGQVTQRRVDQYIAARRASGIADSTIRRELTDLVSAVNWLVTSNRIKKSPLPNLKLPSESPPRARYLSRAELDKLIRHLDESPYLLPVHLFVYVGAYTGARKQAIHDLTWDRLDFQHGTIDFRVPGRRETKKRRTVVPMHSHLREVLLAVPADCRTGKVVVTRDVRKAFARVMQECGLCDVTPHILRHTLASQLASQGKPLAHVAAILGNSVTMTERVYAKVAQENLRDTLEDL